MKPIAIFAATRWELDAVRRACTALEKRRANGICCWTGRIGDQLCWLIQTGIGPARAETVSRAVLQAESFAFILSTGFACALNAARVGDVLVGTEVFQHPPRGRENPLPCSAQLAAQAVSAANKLGLGVTAGRVVSTERVVCLGEDKRVIATMTGGIGLDMESAALTEVAKDAGTPIAIVRTISDERDEDLPLDFNLFLRPTGWMSGVISCVQNPFGVLELFRLRRQSRLAGMHLTRLCTKFLSLRVSSTSP